MEIQNSLNRFVSIFFIVALGVAFFSGVRAAEPDMRYSGDAYFDARDMMDLRIMSTMGLTESDIESIKAIEGVEKVEAGYTIDVLSMMGESERIIHIESLPETMNKIDVAEGRLPQKKGECIIDMDAAASANIQVGDILKFKSGTEDTLEDNLSVTEYEVVGTCSSPMYISFNRGSTNIGNGEIDMFAYVTADSFCQEVYSKAYVTVTGAKEIVAFTEEHRETVDAVKERIEDIADVRCDVRYAEIMDEANEEIGEAESELESAKDEVDEELADAKKELHDGEKAIADGKAQLSSSQRELADARKQLEDSRITLDDGWKEYKDGLKEIEDGKVLIADAEAEIKTNEKLLADGEIELANAEALIAENEQKVSEGEAAIEAAGKEIEAGEKQILEYEKGIADAKALIEGLDSGWIQYEKGVSDLNMLKEQIRLLEVLVNGGLATSDQATMLVQLQEQAEQGEQLLAQSKQQLENMEAMRPQAEMALANEQAVIDARAEFDAGKAEWLKNKEIVDAGRAELEAGKAELAARKQELKDGKAALEAGKKELAAEKQKLIDGEAQLKNAYKELTKGEEAYAKGLEQIQAGQAQLASAYATIAANEVKLADGWEEFEEGKREAEEKIFDAEIKILDAKNEIADIETPSWYVNDREADMDYLGYSQNAERMGAIGKVFPLLFFLVAALVSLTTMTRMVEENRMQIGTLKALGYRKFWIAFKYIGYALMATLGGSILGVLFGEKVFPLIIVKAYKILYFHIPDVVVPYHLGYAVMGTGAALACTMLATISSCYRALAAQPAELMRPEAPQAGKKVLLERIPALWASLNFTWKSTIRNLMRYKKRFFMTIFGIGGCMALMLVGYGLKDSIMDVTTLQFGKIHKYDLMAVIDTDITEENKAKLEQQLKEEEHIQGHMEGYIRMTEMTFGNTNKDLYLYVPSTLKDLDQFITFNYRTTGESWMLEEDSVVITEKVARDLGIERGDEIQLKLEEDHLVTVKITDICENYLAHYVYMTPQVYKEVTGSEPEYNAIYATVSDEATDDLEKVGAEFLKNDGVLTVSYTHTTADDLSSTIGVLDSVIVVLIAAAGMLAFVVLYNLNNININERKRELATLKVLGFYDSEVAAYVYRENVVLTFMGAGVGVVLGKLLHGFIVKTVEVDQTMFGLNITLKSYLLAIGFTVLFSLLVNGFMYFKLKKIDMVESLKSVE